MAHTTTPIRTEARTTTVAMVHRPTHLPAVAALARSESAQLQTCRLWTGW